MLNNKKVVVVMPAYNAEATLRKTVAEVPSEIVDEIILTDDCSRDRTAEIARELQLTLCVHRKNLGYGGNQKTCYAQALQTGADIIIMVHPDYQYTPKLISAMACMIAYGVYDAALASRILGKGALKGGMPPYKYVANRLLTLFQNIVFGQKLSEYHTGYRAYSKETLLSLGFENNSNDFVFDNQLLAQLFYKKYRIGEISCPTVYAPESSSIGFKRSVRYGIGCLWTSLQFLLARWGLAQPKFLTGGAGAGALKQWHQSMVSAEA